MQTDIIGEAPELSRFACVNMADDVPEAVW